MYFFKKKPRVKNKKSDERLQRQQYLAKYDPSNIVDYSECNLCKIPSGTYSLCNLFLKEVLILHTNYLSDFKEETGVDDEVGSNLSSNFLNANHVAKYKNGERCEDLKKLRNLRSLDLHNNQIIRLPVDISFLVNLQHLNLENNRLEIVIPELCRLVFLQILNLKKNQIRDLPRDIGNLTSLKSLDVSQNLITSLPKSLVQVTCLEMLILDQHNMEYPSPSICCEGTSSIMEFLCQESGLPYTPPSTVITDFSAKPSNPSFRPTMTNTDFSRLSPLPGLSHSSEDIHCSPKKDSTDLNSADALSTRIDQYEMIKEQKIKELAKLQNIMLKDYEKEALLVAEGKNQRRSVLLDIEQENRELGARLDQINEQRDKERLTILQELKEGENTTKLMLDKLCKEQEEAKKKLMLEESEYKRQNEDNVIRLKLQDYENLRKKDIEDAIKWQIKQLCDIEYLQHVNEAKRHEILQNIMKLEKDDDQSLAHVLRSKHEHVESILSNVARDEQMQKRALLLLMQRKDDRMTDIQIQLQMIQDGLAKLTAAEMKNRDIKDSVIQQQLIDQRTDLKIMISMLIEEREKRNSEFRRRMLEMEKQRLDEQADYWLVQYQRLLDTKPDNLLYMEKRLDERVKQVLIDAKATIYLPNFARKNISMKLLMEKRDDRKFFERIGVHEEYLLNNILDVLHARREVVTSPTTPTSPVRARFEMECVVCMNGDSCTVFLPCGHVCCCSVCQESLSECPLCRCIIDQRVDLSQGEFEV